MFKCRGQNICVHLGDVCNGKKDCLHGDDEYFCELLNSVCPLKCEGLTAVIWCINVHLTKYSHEQLLYTAVYIEKGIYLENTVRQFKYSVILTIANTNLKEICKVTSGMRNLKTIEAAL